MSNNKTIEKLKTEIAEYFYHGFLILKEHSSFEKTLDYVDCNMHRIVGVRRNGQILGIAVFLSLTDLTLKKIELGEIDLKKPEHMKEAEKEKGENIHFFAVRSDSSNNAKFIMVGIRDIIKRKNPKTVSWIKPDSEKLFIIKRKDKHV